ncbi:alpha/beta hydrolase [Myxococcus llanfairpwllgwyngyllgogerychwyrndrobwllllantysiliogogogochensis]|uniref:Alpha/beta hydrolase n=1 Tax=Myxococcus llanfairpwllgwyngyllgogerychwyrndrobwllllantysiliogogogochensis TaxID=2590453 RepID=A0A540X7T8_9BACT|nr:alpha/beta hydrolase [Myxococcus llanfairpwllgwyngyllgogerychwyrndrobwllllantysiliogogogochensis]TQF17248.1 alpha/beta hydrolase [Myxococcus llanfairpwllgwyngyllgogerychwyrndrobwllllantysiliogogogochensis]
MKTMNRFTLAVMAILCSTLWVTGCDSENPPPKAPENRTRGAYASVNGINLYYELHGTGRPVVMLHGGLSTIDTTEPFLSTLARSRQVIAVELQAHGRTADIDRPMKYELMADDIAALIKHLGFESADVCGFSLGGGVAIQLGIRHPSVVRKLVVVSAPFKSNGWYPEVRAGMAYMDADALAGSPPHEAYVRVAPRPGDWPVLVSKLRQLLAGEEYDWTDTLRTLKAPTLIVAGDTDNMPPAHLVEMLGVLGGGKADGAMGNPPSSRLAVLPGVSHWSILTRTDLLEPIVPAFLDEPMPAAKP